MNSFFGILVFIILPILFFIFVGWFFKNNQIKEDKSTEVVSRNLFDLLKVFKSQYPGFKGGVFYYGILVVFTLLLVIKAYNVFYGVN